MYSEKFGFQNILTKIFQRFFYYYYSLNKVFFLSLSLISILLLLSLLPLFIQQHSAKGNFIIFPFIFFFRWTCYTLLRFPFSLPKLDFPYFIFVRKKKVLKYTHSFSPWQRNFQHTFTLPVYFWSLTLNLIFFPLFLHRSCVLSPEPYQIQTSTPEFPPKKQRYGPSRKEISRINYEKLVWRAEGRKDGNFFVFVIIPHHGYIYSCNPFMSSKIGGERFFSFECGCWNTTQHGNNGTAAFALNWNPSAT